MKLKLENQDQATILVVTEAIEASHLPILKAGLGKLFQAGKKAVILDFSAAREADFKEPGLMSQISELRAWAMSLGNQVAVVSALPKLGHAPTRSEALKLLAPSPATAPLAPAEDETSLAAQLKQLELRKAELEKKIGGPATEADLKKLQQRNSMLKKNIRQAEKIAAKYLKLRTKEPVAPPPGQASSDTLHKLVESFLTQEGVLK
jgi:hypothetical protein